jgi:hypothetical protein
MMENLSHLYTIHIQVKNGLNRLTAYAIWAVHRKFICGVRVPILVILCFHPF